MFPIVRALRQRGMDIVTVQDSRCEGTDDPELLEDALLQRRILLTNDTDFLVLASKLVANGDAFAPVFFWPQQQRSVGEVMRAVIREASRDDDNAICSQVFFL